MLARRMINQRLKGFVQVVDASHYTAFSPNNGNNWYVGSLATPASGGVWFTGAYGNGYLLVSEADNTDLAVSVNAGFTWNYYDSVLPIERMVLGFGDGVFVGVPINFNPVGTSGSTGSTTAAYSTDNGETWTSATLPSEQSWSSVAHGDGVFVAVSGYSLAGGGADSTAAAYSTDGGKTWTASTLPSSTAWSSVAYGNGVFVAVSSSGNDAAYSTNGGQTWTASTLPFAGSGSNFVCYGAGTFVASANNNGNSDANIAAYSTDGGQTWTNSPYPGVDVIGWGPVTYGDGIFMVGGYAGCYTSTNGDGWNEVGGGIFAGQLDYIAAIIYVDPYS